MVKAAPSHVRVRTYQVGFGDCILITVSYDAALPDGRAERHILVDFGAKVLAKGGPTMPQLAAKIVEHCGGHLDVVVVTHRHQDHVRGFGEDKARTRLDALQPGAIIRPWTDMPVAARKASAADLGDSSHAFLSLLDTLEDHSQGVEQQFALDRRVLAERAGALAKLGVKNVQALAMLDVWVEAGRTHWVRAGDSIDLTQLLPGVQLEVLGPPTLEQVPAMKSYASSSTEYWLGMAGSAQIQPELSLPADDDINEAKELLAAPDGLGKASWLIDRLHDQAPRQVLDIVEGFDDVLNNTSVVLLATAGRRTLLLAGDAQVENWSYSLDRALGANGQRKDTRLNRRLAAVDLYKVGHHGSRNATPKRLVELWTHGRPAGHRLCSVLSTREGVYGTTTEGKVPKQELIDALRGLGELHSTQDLPKDVWWFDVDASATTDAADFAYSAGPPQP